VFNDKIKTGMSNMDILRLDHGGERKEGIFVAGYFLSFSRIALATLVMCTSGLVLAIRASRNRVTEGGHRYISSTAVVMAELVKIVASTVLYAREEDGADGKSFASKLHHDLIENWRDTLMLGVPGALYLAQNNILFIALSHLDAATFQITYQLKILTTAVFSVLMLGRRYTHSPSPALSTPRL